MNSKIIAFAIEAHHKTNHLYDGKPYSVHLSMVAMYGLKHIDIIPLLMENNVMDACWLHDTIEDCRLTYNDIKEVAGDFTADIVYAVTNEKGKNRKERANEKYYEGIRNTPYAIYVKLCDRLANVEYSVHTKSKMLDVYRKENESFLESLFPDYTVSIMYHAMINELDNLLTLNTPTT